jgi:uncharacterized membrane protein
MEGAGLSLPTHGDECATYPRPDDRCYPRLQLPGALINHPVTTDQSINAYAHGGSQSTADKSAAERKAGTLTASECHGIAVVGNGGSEPEPGTYGQSYQRAVCQAVMWPGDSRNVVHANLCQAIATDDTDRIRGDEADPSRRLTSLIVEDFDLLATLD